jgi:hypothetical protein
MIPIINRYDYLNQDEREDITLKAQKLLGAIDDMPKSKKWKWRSLLRNKVKWYREVETEETVSGFGIWRLKDVYGVDFYCDSP